MNTIQPHSASTLDYDALCTETNASPGDSAAAPPTDAKTDATLRDAAIDPSDLALATLPEKEPVLADELAQKASLAEPVVLAPKSLFDWAGSLFRTISTSLARLVRSLNVQSIRVPNLRADSFDRLARSEEDTRKDVQRGDLKKKIVVQEPLQVITLNERVQRLVGDEIVIETIHREESTRSSITGDGRVVAEMKDGKVTS